MAKVLRRRPWVFALKWNIHINPTTMKAQVTRKEEVIECKTSRMGEGCCEMLSSGNDVAISKSF